MIRQQFLTYYKGQQEVVDQNLKIARVSFEKKAIRNFRVGTKKVRALLRLMGVLFSEYDANRYTTYLQQLARAAGKVRDAQVQTGIILRYNKKNEGDFSAILAYFQREEHMHAPLFTEAIAQFDEALFLRNYELLVDYLNGVDEDVIFRNALSFLCQLLTKIKKLKKKSHNEEKMHDLRTMVKRALYVIRFLNQPIPIFNLAEMAAQFKLAAKDLGKWHDCTVFRLHYALFWEQSKGSLSKKQKKGYKQLVADLQNRENTLLQDALLKLEQMDLEVRI